MRLRSFTAPSMPAAIKLVREEMGENAIIIASETTGKRSIKVTAAVEQSEEDAPRETPKKLNGHAPHAADTSSVDDLRFDLQTILRFHNLPEIFISKIIQTIPDKDLASLPALMRIGGREDKTKLARSGLEKLLGSYFSFSPLPFNKPGTHLMLVGAPGIGKTFTIAKMASRLAMDKIPFTVITTDNKRAGGIEQLKAFTNILDVPLEVVTSKKELKQHLANLPTFTHALIDTSGCNAYEPAEMSELEGYASLPGVEPVLVMAAGGDSLEAIDTTETFAEIPIRRLLVTRADTARRFGSILAVAAAYDLAFCNISASSSVVDSLRPADTASLAELLLRYQLQT